MNRFLLVNLACLICSISFVKAQTSESRFVAELSSTFVDYQGPLTNDYFQFNTFDPGVKLGAQAYVNSFLNISLNSSFIPSSNYPLDEVTILSTSLIDVNTLAHIKSNNGSLLPENFFVAPYLATGIGLNTASNNLRWYLPAALGLRFRITKSFSFNIESMYKVALDGKQQHISHSGGFVFSLPTNTKPEKKKPERPNNRKPNPPKEVLAELSDTDGDGIPDIDDRCPDEKGLVLYFGCPDPNKGDEGSTIDAGAPVYAETPSTTEINSSDDLAVENVDSSTEAYDPSKPSVGDLEFLANAMEMIYFKSSSDEIAARSFPVLNRIASIMSKYPSYNLRISGYTDNQGDVKTNKILSVNRAFSVKRYLAYKQGVKLNRLISDGFGDKNPIADNSTDEGRRLNRRVEFTLFR